MSVICGHCEGWGCSRCKAEREAAKGGEQGLSPLEVENAGLREEVTRLRAENGQLRVDFAKDMAAMASYRNDIADLRRQLGEVVASLEEHVAAFDRQVAEYRRGGSEEIARIAEQVHGKRMDRARAAIANARPTEVNRG